MEGSAEMTLWQASAGPEAAEKWQRLRKRSVEPFPPFNLHQIGNWLHFQTYYCRRRGGGCKVALQGHQPHPWVPECVLGYRMYKAGGAFNPDRRRLLSDFPVGESGLNEPPFPFSLSQCERRKTQHRRHARRKTGSDRMSLRRKFITSIKNAAAFRRGVTTHTLTHTQTASLLFIRA